MSEGPDARLSFYIVHQNAAFRMSIPINAAAISGIAATVNESSHAGQVAVSFDLAAGTAEYACWRDQGGGRWFAVADFTSGQAPSGVRCEITGPKAVSGSDWCKGHSFDISNFCRRLQKCEVSSPACQLPLPPTRSSRRLCQLRALKSGTTQPTCPRARTTFRQRICSTCRCLRLLKAARRTVARTPYPRLPATKSSC